MNSVEAEKWFSEHQGMEANNPQKPKCGNFKEDLWGHFVSNTIKMSSQGHYTSLSEAHILMKQSRTVPIQQ